MATIEKAYRAYDAQVFTKNGRDKEAFTRLVEEFNQSDEKDYNLLIFLQNNSYTNVRFHEGKIEVYAREKGSIKVKAALENIKKCKDILLQGNLRFEVQDMHIAVKQAKPGEFYLLTPPHENDQAKLYASNITTQAILDSLAFLDEHKIPFLITYGDNTTQRATNLQDKISVHCFPFVILGGMDKMPKKMVIYTSLNVLQRQKLALVIQKFQHQAGKAEKLAQENLARLNCQQNRRGKDSSYYSQFLKLLQEVTISLQSVSAKTSLPSGLSGKEEDEKVDKQLEREAFLATLMDLDELETDSLPNPVQQAEAVGSVVQCEASFEGEKGAKKREQTAGKFALVSISRDGIFHLKRQKREDNKFGKAVDAELDSMTLQ